LPVLVLVALAMRTQDARPVAAAATATPAPN
jgi:hypothetical protein